MEKAANVWSLKKIKQHISKTSNLVYDIITNDFVMIFTNFVQMIPFISMLSINLQHVLPSCEYFCLSRISLGDITKRMLSDMEASEKRYKGVMPYYHRSGLSIEGRVHKPSLHCFQYSAYLEPSRTSMMEFFFRRPLTTKAVKYFCKNMLFFTMPISISYLFVLWLNNA